MYAIIKTNTAFTVGSVKKYFLLARYSFTELGYSVKLTKKVGEAKQYKSYIRAYSTARNLGTTFQVIKL